LKFEKLYLDLLPDYITFEFQSTKSDGTKFDPTGTPTVSIYEESGSDASYDNSPISGSPFNMSKINTKTGNYGVLVDKTLFTAGKLYRVLYEATVDSIDTAKIEYYIALDFGNNVWDELLTGDTHNVQNSAGKKLRDISSIVMSQNIARVGSTTNTIILASNEPAVDGNYDPAGIAIIDGTGKGQTRLLLEYEGSTRKAVVDRDWKVIPDDTSEYIIYANPGREHVNEGLAQAGSLTTITLNTLASSFDNAYTDQEVFIRSGKGADQVRRVTNYAGSTKVATIDVAWDVTPDSTSAYVMLPKNSTSTLIALLEAIDTSAESQARFTEIKGSGWTVETLKKIYDDLIARVIENFTVKPGSNS
jgi:hypothetical protein